MTSDPARVQAIFLGVVETPAGERRAQIERECRGNAEMRRRVDALLKAHDDTGSFLDSPPPGIDVSEVCAISEQPGDMIGPYRLVEPIGEGGFGVVFLAEQERPVRRRVAVKIIKPGMDTRQVIARFEAERQALAMMDHSNIAKVYDAGATETGRPYFVMELVQGAALTEYCNECNLTTRERLELFVAVCQAVQHAHQKGVIHRDIKPSNVLVAMQDGSAAPKIIDFGVAKALNQRLTEHTHVTAFAQMIGTPLYMAPEQAELSAMGVDTRSDIYSLGVLLYELLTGTTPFDGSRLRAADFDEMRRILRDEEPPRPSARLSTLAAEQATAVAAQHRTDARRLAQTIQGELDWIVMKCLEKDRNRRYETANDLARDIERYLRDEPVTACPPSAGYRFRKFARRNKAALLAATAGVATLLVLIAGLAISNRLIAEQRERAEAQTILAQEKAIEEQRARAQAIAEAEKSNAVVTLMQDMLAAAHPDSAGGTDVTVRALVDQFSTGLEDRLADQPDVEAALREIIGSVYTRLRLLDEAEPHLRRALLLNHQVFGDQHVKFADSQRHLAWNLLEKNRASAEVEALARNALAIYQNDKDPSKALEAMWLLILSLDGQSRPNEAEAAASEALDVAKEHSLTDHTVVPNILHQLAWINIRRGNYSEAERLARESVEKHLKVHGESHPETAFGWTYLAAALSWQGKFAEAEECLKKSLSIFRRSLPANHSFLRPTLQDLMSVLHAQGKYDEIIRQSRETIELEPENAEAHNYLAWMLCTCPDPKLREPEEAVKLAARAALLAANSDKTRYLNTLGVAQYRAGDYSAARETLQKSIEERNGGDCNDWFFLAMAEWQLGNRDVARDWYGKASDWMSEHGSQDKQFIRFRDEAKQLTSFTEDNVSGAE